MTSYTHDLHAMLFAQGFAWPTWGTDLDHVLKSGTTGFELVHRGRIERFQPDGGLQLAGSKMPFLVVEVADSEVYAHVLEKGRRYLLHSQGLIRFVIIIKLVWGRAATKLEEGEEGDGLGDGKSFGQQESSPHRRVGSNKRVAGNHSRQFLRKKARTTTLEGPLSDSEIVQNSPTESHRDQDAPVPHDPPDPPGSQVLPPNPRNIYSRGLVAVLGTKFITTAGKKKRVLVHLVDTAEFWPTPPALTAVFSFSWADMPVVSYPSELVGKQFTVTFGRLHALLQRFFEVGTAAWGGDGVPVDCADDVEYLTSSEKEGEKTVDGDKWRAMEAPVTSGEAEEDGDWRNGWKNHGFIVSINVQKDKYRNTRITSSELALMIGYSVLVP